jgi:hypothetical protein
MQFAFGSGSLWGVDSGANPTPGKFAILQEVGLDWAYSNKPLYGSYQLPVAVGRGTAKISWKAKLANLSGRVYNALFFGATKTSGSTLVAEGESGTITTGAVTVANSANFVTDLGVTYSATGLPLVRVASAPATGQYTVSAGVYSFNTGENGTIVKIDYTYTASATGEKIAIANTLLGAAPTFQAVLTQLFNGKRQTLVLNANTSSKLGNATKLDDFTMPEFEADVFADAGNNVATWSLGDPT